jgi:hypothetical protein
MEVKISRGLLSTYWTLALILTGVMSPLLGKLYAAVGARMMIAVAGIFLLPAMRLLRIAYLSPPSSRPSLCRHRCFDGPRLEWTRAHRAVLGIAHYHVSV